MISFHPLNIEGRFGNTVNTAGGCPVSKQKPTNSQNGKPENKSEKCGMFLTLI
jgi:hypothetical protein